jgi:hypothetical protein
VSLPPWTSTPASISLSQLGTNIGCYGYNIIANVTVATNGTNIRFSVGSALPAENLQYEIVSSSGGGGGGGGATGPITTSPITVTPSTSTGSITLAGGAQTTTGSFVVGNPVNSGIASAAISITNISRPSSGSAAVSLSTFTLAAGQTQIVSFTCTSPATHTGAPYTYQFGVLIVGDTGTYPIHTHTQNF